MARLWLQFLDEIGKTTEQIPDPELQSEPVIAKALDLMQVSAFNEAELQAYHHSLDEWRSFHTLMDDTLAKGKAEGKAEGIEAVAKAMKQKGLPIEVIADVTGLSLTVIAGL